MRAILGRPRRPSSSMHSVRVCSAHTQTLIVLTDGTYHEVWYRLNCSFHKQLTSRGSRLWTVSSTLSDLVSVSTVGKPRWRRGLANNQRAIATNTRIDADRCERYQRQEVSSQRTGRERELGANQNSTEVSDALTRFDERAIELIRKCLNSPTWSVAFDLAFTSVKETPRSCGWGQCGHGLSSRPRESCDLSILTPLLDFFGYPDGAATDLFYGTSKLWPRPIIHKSRRFTSLCLVVCGRCTHGIGVLQCSHCQFVVLHVVFRSRLWSDVFGPTRPNGRLNQALKAWPSKCATWT